MQLKCLAVSHVLANMDRGQTLSSSMVEHASHVVLLGHSVCKDSGRDLSTWLASAVPGLAQGSL